MGRLITTCIGVTMILAAGRAWPESGITRISGVVGQNGHWLYAIAVSADGSCRLLSEGALIDGGRVVAITPHGVRVTIDGRQMLLPLQGGEQVPAAGGSVDGTPQPTVTCHSVPREQVLQILSKGGDGGGG